MNELQRFIERYNNQYVDTDGFYGYQCWDLFDRFCYDYNINVSRYCSLTGYVPDLFYLYDEYGYSDFFEKINVEDLQVGDWCFWDYGNMHHVALKVGANTYFSQNPNPSQVITLSPTGLIGGLRPKLSNWITDDSEHASMEETNIYALAVDVINGRYGNDPERSQRLGSIAQSVQSKVNEYYFNREVFINAVADLVCYGYFGNDPERAERLGAVRDEVQSEVDRRY